MPRRRSSYYDRVNSEHVRVLIRKQLGAINKTMAEVSRAIGKNHAYLQQFMERGVPRALDEDTREKLAKELGVLPEELRNKPAPGVKREPGLDLPKPFISPLAGPSSSRTLPILGKARGGLEGILLIPEEARPVDWTYRPPQLEGVEEAYAFQVVGDSQSPAYNDGDIAWVNPHAPMKPGNTVIIQRRDDSVLVKTLVRRTQDSVLVRQHNPPAEFEVPKADIRSMHRVLGKWET